MARGRSAQHRISAPLRGLRSRLSGIPAGLDHIPGLTRDPLYQLRITEGDQVWVLEVDVAVPRNGMEPAFRMLRFRTQGETKRLKIYLNEDGSREIFDVAAGVERRHCAYAPAHVTANGDQHWYLDGELHRDDAPAIEHADGGREWFRRGVLHRENGPAREMANGYAEWRLDGDLHRIGGPAVVFEGGSLEWWENGKQHRADGPAFEANVGDKVWYRHGICHRTDGPAVEHFDGSREWKQDGALHRTDGPAVIKVDGTEEWWIRGKQISKATFDRFHSSAGSARTVNGPTSVASAMSRR